MFNKHVSYSSVVYSITKGYINENSAKFYLYWQDKVDNIDIADFSIVDKVFVLMCRKRTTSGVKREFDVIYNIKIDKSDIDEILINCQCFDIEVTIMAKSFYRYRLYPGNLVAILEEQIGFIQQHGSIDLPYTYELSEKD